MNQRHTNSLLVRLQRWYHAQCNGDWEHDYGVTIYTCDNPGWGVKIELKGTALEHVRFERVAENVGPGNWQEGPRWLCCQVADGIWSGAGDETKLERILEIFLNWAEAEQPPLKTA